MYISLYNYKKKETNNRDGITVTWPDQNEKMKGMLVTVKQN